jgi:hypothetical protein
LVVEDQGQDQEVATDLEILKETVEELDTTAEAHHLQDQEAAEITEEEAAEDQAAEAATEDLLAEVEEEASVATTTELVKTTEVSKMGMKPQCMVLINSATEKFNARNKVSPTP